MSTSVTFNALRINNAEQLKESVFEPNPNTKIYLTYGKILPWNSQDTPLTPNSSVSTIYEIWNNMIGAKLVNGSDIHHVIPRYNWTYDTTYTAYDHLNANLFEANVKFYIITKDNNVYKCLANNYGTPSTVEPTSVNPEVETITSDGYIWKYMYTIADNELLRFTTTDYIPVKTLINNDGSSQWTVQEAAKDGAINYVYVTNSGNSYSNTSNIVFTLTGDGDGFQGYAVRNTITNTIQQIIVTNPGSGYTHANVVISDLGTGKNAAARAIISPPGGHGSNPLYELGGKNLMFNIRLKYDENNILPATNDFRQIAILKDPLERDSSNVLYTPAFHQSYILTLYGSNEYQEDEIVYQGPNLANATFRGEVVSWSNAKMHLINTKGTPALGELLYGIESNTFRQISDIELGQAKKYSGNILYVDNIKPIVRSEDQIEDFKILVKF